MRVKYYILILFVYTIFGACVKKEVNIDANILDLDVPIGEIQPIRFSEIISEYKAIKLEFTDQSMIGDIRKINIYKDNIYILDTFGAKSVMVFNLNGDFVKRIGENGKGPGQYILPKDFIIDSIKNEIGIIDNRKLIVYDINGEYKKSFKFDFGSENFEMLGNNYFFSAGDLEDSFLLKTNDKFDKIEKYINKEPKSFIMDGYRPFQKWDKSHLLYWTMMSDTVYLLSNEKVKPFRHINFGKYKFRFKEYQTLPFEKKTKILLLRENEDQCILVRYIENHNYIHLVYNLNSKYYEFICNKVNNKTIHFNRENIIDDITLERESWYLVGGDEDQFYYMIHPYKYKSTKQLRKFLESFTSDEEEIQEMIHETSNPIILLAKYKL